MFEIMQQRASLINERLSNEAIAIPIIRQIYKVWASDVGLGRQEGVREVRFVGDLFLPPHTIRYIGIYRYAIREVHLNRKFWFPASLREKIDTLAHEFAHHVQLMAVGGDDEKAFPLVAMNLAHCRRPHERWAKDVAFRVASYVMARIESGDVTVWPKVTGLEGTFPRPEGRPPYLGAATLEQTLEQVLAQEDVDVGDWAFQIALLQPCFPSASIEKIADKYAAAQPLTDEERDLLMEWAECADQRAFLPPLDDVFERLLEDLRSTPREAERVWELTTKLEALREAHETDPCVPYRWLAPRTAHFRDPAALTLRQYQRLTGHRHPGTANLLPGNLVPWEYATDEVADRLGMTTDQFADCVARAYNREREIFSILNELKELLR